MQIYDCIILGSGPAGLTAAIYSEGCNIVHLVCCGNMKGGLITTTDYVDNYPGSPLISGYDLAEKWIAHAQQKGCELTDAHIDEIISGYIKINDQKIPVFKLVDTFGHIYYGITIILCTGSNPNKLPASHKGAAVYYCATCDGQFVKNENATVIGGGNSAVEAVLYLSGIAKHVYLIYRGDKLHRPHASLVEKIHTLVAQGKVTILYNTEVKSIENRTVYLNNGILSDIKGTFVYIGHTPNTQLVANIGADLSPDRSVIVNSDYETTIPGIYAAGDVIGDVYRDKANKIIGCRYKQIVNSQAEGMAAALNINNKYRTYFDAIKNNHNIEFIENS